MALITETQYLEAKPRVDIERGVIPGVKVLGFESKNGRTYDRKAVSEALPLYEGAKAFINHPKRSELSEDRSFRDWAGVLENVTIASDGAYADLRLRQKAPCYSELIEAAQDFWRDFGMSHVADGTSRMDGDREVIESISEILSVDVVCSPATTSGLYESTNSKGKPMAKKKTKTIRQIIEDSPSKTKNRKLLVEAMHDENGNPIAEMPIEISEPEPEAESKPEDEIMNGLLAAIAAKVKEADPETLKKVMALLDLGTDVVDVAGGTGGGEGDAGDSGGDGEKTTESKRVRELEHRLALQECKGLLLESGRESSSIRVKALAAASTADRKELLESWPKQVAAGTTNGSRPASSPPADDGGAGVKLYESQFDGASKRASEAFSRKHA